MNTLYTIYPLSVLLHSGAATVQKIDIHLPVAPRASLFFGEKAPFIKFFRRRGPYFSRNFLLASRSGTCRSEGVSGCFYGKSSYRPLDRRGSFDVNSVKKPQTAGRVWRFRRLRTAGENGI